MSSASNLESSLISYAGSDSHSASSSTLPRYGYPQRVTYMTYMGGRGAINRGTATIRGNTLFRARCFFHIFSSLIFAVTQMQMMPVLEPQDQTSVLVIRVIEEVLVLVGKYILALRLVRSHFEQNADIIIIIIIIIVFDKVG